MNEKYTMKRGVSLYSKILAGIIVFMMGLSALGAMNIVVAEEAGTPTDILVVSDINIPNRVIMAGENSPIQFALENIGDVDATHTLADVYEVQGETEVFLKTLHYNKIKPGHEKQKTVVWAPPNVGYYYLKLVITYQVNGENFEMVHESGFNAIRNDLPVIKFNNDWVVDEPTEYDNVVILVGGDVYVNAPLTLTDVHILAGNWEVLNVLTVEQLSGTASLNMECGYNGQYSMWVRDTGTLRVLGSELMYNAPSNYNYGFIVDGQLIVDGGTIRDVGFNANVVGTHPANSGTGIRLFNPSKTSEFINGATVTECLSYGIYADGSRVIVRDSFVMNNGQIGIFMMYSDNSIIENNDLSSNGQRSIFLGYSDGNTIIDNIATVGGGTVFASSNYNTIRNNEFYSGTGVSISGTSHNNVFELNNLSLSNYGVYLTGGPSGPYSNTITQNEIWHNSIHGIYSHMRGNANTISWNNIYYNTYGVYLYVTQQNSVQNNNIGYNEKGIVSYLSGSHQFRDNVITNNDYGIWQSADDGILTIEGNIITDNNNYGIYCLNARAGYIRGNTIENNVDGGIYCYQSSHAIEDNPSISNNGNGIYTELCSPTIQRNTIGEGYYQVDNEMIYGPATGGETGPIYLANGNVLNCTVYVDDGVLNKLVEWSDYVLYYDTGTIDITPIAPMNPGWIFYAYYNYSEGTGNTYGIYSVSSTPNIVDNTIVANEENGIYIDNQNDFARNPTIDNNVIVGNRNGIELFQSYATITNNNVLSNIGAGIHIEQSQGEIAQNTILNNSEPRGPPPDPEFTGIKVLNSNNLWIHHNNVSHNGANIHVSNSLNVLIEWNEILDETAVIYIYPTPSPPRGIYSVSSQIEASNNIIWGTIIGIQIEYADSTTLVHDNQILPPTPPGSGHATVGVYLINAAPQVEWNTIDGIRTGIYCEDNSNALLANNVITNGDAEGIYSEDSSPTITGNTINGNVGWGILCEYGAPSNAGNNGDQIVIDNPNLGDNGEGRIKQVWDVQIRVMLGPTPQTGVYVEVVPYLEIVPIFTGYTDGTGYTENFNAVQYIVENGGILVEKNSHAVFCDTVLRDWHDYEYNGIYVVNL